MVNSASCLLLIGTSIAAGAINAVAGGGTILTFPALLAAGLPPVTANATSTVALVPGSLAAAFGFRNNIAGSKSVIIWLATVNLLGGLIGARLVLWGGDQVLARLVPWLILGATLLFVLQEPVSRMNSARAQRFAQPATFDDRQVGKAVPSGPPDNFAQWASGRLAMVLFFQFLVAVYGGFFGAGIGILNLAALGFLGLTDIHQMNGLKNIASVVVNVTASITFVIYQKVNWTIAIMMAVGAIAGGYSGSGLALKMGQKRVRQMVILIGLGVAAAMFWRQVGSGR